MTTRKRRTIHALTGVRGLAALWIVLHHLREPPYHLDFGVFEPLMVSAGLAVDLFFVLSGFIMAYVYQGAFSGRPRLSEQVSFLQNRVARLYPVHVLTLVWMLPIYWVAKVRFDRLPQATESYTPQSIVANLLMVQDWFPTTGSPNAPAWSISAEWFAYLLFPFLALLFALLRGKRAAAGYWPLVVAVAVCLAAEMLPKGNGLIRVTTAFLFGMVLFELRQLRDRLPAFGSLLFLGLLLAMIYSGRDTSMGLIIPVIGGMLLSLANEGDYGARSLSTRPARYLGEISYSIYMVHWLVVTIIRRGIPAVFPGTEPINVYTIAAGVLLTVLLAAAVYKYVEVPGRRYMRDLRIPGLTRT